MYMHKFNLFQTKHSLQIYFLLSWETEGMIKLIFNKKSFSSFITIVKKFIQKKFLVQWTNVKNIFQII